MQAARAGYRIVYDPEAIAYEDSVPNLKSEFNRKSRIAAGAVQMMKWGLGIPNAMQKLLWFQFLSHKFLRWVMPFILIALFSVNLRLVLTEGHFGIYWVTAAVQIVFYLLGVCGVFFNRMLMTAVSQYFCITYAAFMVGLIKGITNRQQVTWKVSR